MLNNETRELLVEAYKNYTAKELSEIFNIHISSVYRIVKQKRDTGCVKLQTNKRGRKSVLTEKDLKNISGLIDSQPDITINEIIEKLELKATNETVRKAVIKMGYKYKKKSLHASERERPDVIYERKNWIGHLPEYDKNRLVFIDESGVNTDLARIYGRAIDGERCVDKVPLNTPQNTTILSSVRYNGETVYTVYQGGTTSDKFADYLKNTLAPTLHKDDIVIMDNMRTHHSKEVKKIIEELKINVVYLPPYSPDFNPIEKMWSKIKSILRKLKVRVLENLPDAIKYSFSKVCESDCLGWFHSCFIY